MNDKELLMMAAKASGLPLLYPNKGGEDFLISYEKTWNPLTDDGDAMRLAVKLGIDVMPVWGGESCAFMPDGSSFYVEIGCDNYASMRRAIVMAAAEIGSKL